ncbi:hypothetical protein RMSM_05292 [Rhodopirellula maiorica SM1]|uniref:Uncharacterized protein n=1 Tax=Rhodopirellula maiorica SM1 TaxID=1265738 RepID=M5RF98_9BACT|nr:hypothetical protein RMSM_05292 [Rhodopirellula maiorica SM1]
MVHTVSQRRILAAALDRVSPPNCESRKGGFPVIIQLVELDTPLLIGASTSGDSSFLLLTISQR